MPHTPLSLQLRFHRVVNMHLTQQELAELCGLSVRLIRELESGRGNPGLRQLEKLAIALNLTLTLIPKADEAASC